MINIPISSTIIKAQQVRSGLQGAFTSPPIKEVVAAINLEKPDFVFAVHIETSSRIILPDAYIKKVSAAVRKNGGMFVWECPHSNW